MIVKEFFWKIYQCGFLSSIFFTETYLLRRELKNCKSVLDLGCGQNSLIKWVKVAFKTGVDIDKNAGANKIHNKFIRNNICNIKLPEKFDAVIMLDVIEHLEKKQGRKILAKAEKWANKKVIVFTPNGFLPQKSALYPFQNHLSGWTINEMKKRGYKVYGMGGLKFLWKIQKKTTEEFADIRFKPRIFWRAVVELTNIFVYFFPACAFAIFCVKTNE